MAGKGDTQRPIRDLKAWERNYGRIFRQKGSDDVSGYPTTPECPACGGETTLLGQLGNLTHVRCRQCGLTSSILWDDRDKDDTPTEEEGQ